jgi:Zn-dependent metalloprotease
MTTIGNMNTHLPRIQGIIPQEMLKNIAKKGTGAQKDMALHNLSLSGFIRGQRSVLGPMAFITAAPMLAAEKSRKVYDAEETTNLPGDLVLPEGGSASNDVAVNEAYNGAGSTYDLYNEICSRNSIDDKGMPLISTVHYDQNYNNAFWNGQQMVYGDGDGDLFNGFTHCIDVIAHELTHGVTQYEADLVYSNQPGALNESFSDVMGILVKQRVLGQTADKADWLIGEGLFTSKVKGVALRSMKAPGTAYNDPVIGKDPQPANMRNYVKTTSDNGGVHINSGIPNHAFYLAAVEMGGNAWEKAGKIWYIALRDVIRPTSQFRDAARATVQVAGNLFNVGSAEQKAVKNAWAGVGIKI